MMKEQTNSVTMYLLLLTLTSVLVIPSAAAVPTQELSETQVKAAFLFNFSKFIEWPAETFSASKNSVSICVIGSETFAATLEEVTKAKLVNGRNIVVSRSQPSADLRSCHIIFVSADAGSRFKEILGKVKDAHVLTVSEVDGFAQSGGVINFIIRADKLRFEINIDAAERAGLRISSRLLSLARVVHDQRKEKD